MICPSCGANPESRWYCRTCGAPQPAASAVSGGPRRRAWPRRLAWVIGGLGLVATVLLVLASLSFDPAALALAVAASAIPAVIYSYLVLRLDRYEREPIKAVVAAFAWGAVASVLLAIILELITGTVLVATIGDQDAADVLALAVGAPLIEETTKGVALLVLLWFFRRELDNVLDGLVYGALIGLGFAMTENIIYLGSEYLDGGARALGELFVARVVISGFGHAAYTATTGAAVGWTRSRYRKGSLRYFVPVLGWSAAVLMHALWNGSLVFIAGFYGDKASTLHVVLIHAPILTLPPVLALFFIARAAGKRELEVMKTQLASEVAWGVMTPDEFEIVTSNERRKLAVRQAHARGGGSTRDLQKQFFQTAAELAFRKHHLSRGELPAPGQRAPEDVYRSELVHLRGLLAAAGAQPVG